MVNYCAICGNWRKIANFICDDCHSLWAAKMIEKRNAR